MHAATQNEAEMKLETERLTRRRWDMLSVIGVVQTMLKAPDTMGDDAGWVTQQVQHATT